MVIRGALRVRVAVPVTPVLLVGAFALRGIVLDGLMHGAAVVFSQQ